MKTVTDLNNILSSIDTWGEGGGLGQLETTKGTIRNYMILELQGIRKVILRSQINF